MHVLRSALFAILVLLAACAAPNGGETTALLVGTPLENCCEDAEAVPPFFVALIEPAANLIGPKIGNALARPGYLAGPDARAAVLTHLHPLDILAFSNKGRASGGLIPGLFGHVAVYLGTAADLRRLGVWDDPRIVPHHAAITAGAVFIEADQNGVHLSTPQTALNSDRIVVLRPALTRARQTRAVVDYGARVGHCFDFHFNNATPEKIYCSELIAQVLPELNLPSRTLYGRNTTLPDDIVMVTAVERSALNLTAYFRGDANGWQIARRADLVADLLAWWQNPPAPQPLPPPCTATTCVLVD